jgi:hypothetical protein
MAKRFQFGWLIAGLIGIAAANASASALASPRSLQNHPDRAPRTQSAPVHNSASTHNPPAAQRPSGNGQNPNRPPQRQFDRPPNSSIGPGGSNNFNGRPNGGARLTPRQQIGVGAPRQFVDRMRDLTPQQRDRVLQSSRNFQNFSPEQQNRIRQQFNQWDKMNPQQRANLREKENTWRNLTPEQRDHIKNDVLPKWREMPWERQQAIQQKLGVLQNMPESARIRRLSDPNFTRGMSDEDKATLHDLSHLHVGGAPDPPGNE